MSARLATPDGPTPSQSLSLSPAQVQSLAKRCAPTTPAAVLTSVARVESGFNPLLIGVNGRRHRVVRAGSIDEAEAAATRLIASGASLDLGLAQINSRNLRHVGLSVRDAFDPCRNLAAAAQLIDEGYLAALSHGAPNRPLLQMAYSVYNTGGSERGMENGYAAKVDAASRDGR